MPGGRDLKLDKIYEYSNNVEANMNETGKVVRKYMLPQHRLEPTMQCVLDRYSSHILELPKQFM